VSEARGPARVAGSLDAYDRGPQDWGRWGPDDELGRVNLLEPAAVVRAAACIRSGKRFSLALPLCAPHGDPCLPGRIPATHFMTRDEGHYRAGASEPFAGGMKFADDTIILACHGTTHMDALGHAYAGGEIYNGYEADSTTGGLRKASIEPLARQGVVGRALLADIAGHEGVRNLPMHRRISLQDIRGALDAAGATVQPGDILLIRTGIFRVFYEEGTSAFFDDFDEPGATYEPDLVEFLADSDVAGFGTDTLCNEQAHSSLVDAHFPLHVTLQRNLGITFHEALWLEEWAEDCRQDGRYDAFYVAAPLRIVRGTGAPMNPIVIK
jgi:kynurenine formamidase